MTITGKYVGGVLSLVGFIALSSLAFAESSSPGSGGGKADAKTFEQQRSDKTQQGQGLVNKQPMASQESGTGGMQSGNTGADLSGGRDSHLGPHDSQGSSQMQKKDMKGSSTGR